MRITCLVILLAAVLGAMPVSAGPADSECRVDWNENGQIEAIDWTNGQSMEGFYTEIYHYLYTPYYSILFPNNDPQRLDWNLDGNIDADDMYDFNYEWTILLDGQEQTPCPATTVGYSHGWDRANQRSLPLDGVVEDGPAYDTHLYVVDSGINATHAEFFWGVQEGWSAFSGGTDDGNGLGSCLASVAGGELYGMADGVQIHPVRISNPLGSTSWSDVVGGLEWIEADAAQRMEAEVGEDTDAQQVSHPGVVLLALSVSHYNLYNLAVQRLIDLGFVVVVAAGNENQDACIKSPASVTDAIAVGSINSLDEKSNYSNWGPCVDICARGSDITCAFHNSDTATRTLSGTPLAAAQVAGAAAVAVHRGLCDDSESCSDYLQAEATAGVCPILYVGNLTY